MFRVLRGRVLACTLLTSLTFFCPAYAGLILTQAGIDNGFTLTTFVSGYNFGNYGVDGGIKRQHFWRC